MQSQSIRKALAAIAVSALLAAPALPAAADEDVIKLGGLAPL